MHNLLQIWIHTFVSITERSNRMTTAFPYTMLEQYDYIVQLTVKYLLGRTTDREKTDLQTWRNSSKENEEWFSQFATRNRIRTELREMQVIDVEAALKRNHKLIRKGRLIVWSKRVGIAAAVIAIGWLIIPKQKDNVPGSVNITNGHDSLPDEVLPGSNKAMLTLANGRRIDLDSMRQGVLSDQAGIQVTNDSGIVKYSTGARESKAIALYNTLTTPRGGKYQIQLPDGSKAWLNASSSIHYPLAYSTDKRWVEITGEVYFEVAADKSKPFTVLVNGNEVEVLGTHFNINAYYEESKIRVSLLEGKLSVVSGGNKKEISPGHEAEFTSGHEISVRSNANIEDAVAWKEGKFNFNNASIVTIMQQFKRWYDVDVKYLDTPKTKYTWSIERNTDFKNVMEQLDKVIKIKKQDRLLTVSTK